MKLNYLRNKDVRFGIFRPHNVYGPQMGFEHVIPQLSKKILIAGKGSSGAGEVTLQIQGTGEETRSFIFIDDGFFSTLKFAENKKEIIFEKKITIDSNKTDIKIFFENKPLLLRKIIAETEDEIISISFNEHSYNNVFDEKLFSFVPMYPD